MTTYSFLNFVHVVSSIGIVVALAFERLMLIKLLNTKNSVQFQTWRDLHTLPFKIGAPSVAVSLLTGIYLAVTMWPQTPWIWPSIIALLIFAIASGTLASKQHKALVSASSAREIGSAWERLWLSLQLRIGLLVGILFLMVAKPPVNESIAALVLCTLIFIIPVAYFKKKYKPLIS